MHSLIFCEDALKGQFALELLALRMGFCTHQKDDPLSFDTYHLPRAIAFSRFCWFSSDWL